MANRLLELVSTGFLPGDDQSHAVELVGREAVSELFLLRLTVLTVKGDLAAKDVLGKSLSVKVLSGESADPRFMNGMVTAMRSLGTKYRNFYGYEFDLSPAFWLTSLSEECRIFQNKTLREIIDEVLQPYSGKIAFKVTLSASNKREYCVQYNESDFEFLTRLLAEEGCYFFVKHDMNASSSFGQTLVISDSTAGYFTADQAEIEYFADESRQASLTNWRVRYRAHASEWRLSDYNPTDGAAIVEVSAVGREKDYAPHGQKRFRGHGRYPTKTLGEALVKARIAAEDCTRRMIDGSGRYPHFCPGALMTLKNAPDGVQAPGKSVILSVEHTVRDYSSVGAALDAGGDSASPGYENSFTCLPATISYAPRTPASYRPMPGLQTGVVVGPSGEEIHTDEFGRIKVLFHWNRHDKNAADPTCWMRVVQSLAGPTFGAQFIPRIGMEVLVDFIEGDPDRPIVIGSVYNGKNKPPFALPGSKTQSGWRTQSSPGKDKKINELRFEDKTGAEEIYFHAGKDFTRFVQNNDDLKVDNAQTRTIKADRTVKITEGDDKLTLDKGSSQTQIKSGDTSLKIDKGKYSIEVMGDYSLTVKTGDQNTKVNAGSSSLQAAQKIELKVGSSSITLDPAGVTIKAATIKIQAQAMAEVSAPMVKVKASGMATLEASGLTKVEASGMLLLKGGIVMIN